MSSWILGHTPLRASLVFSQWNLSLTCLWACRTEVVHSPGLGQPPYAPTPHQLTLSPFFLPAGAANSQNGTPRTQAVGYCRPTDSARTQAGGGQPSPAAPGPVLVGADLRKTAPDCTSSVCAPRKDSEEGTYSSCGWRASGACRWGAAAGAGGSRSGPGAGGPGEGRPCKASSTGSRPCSGRRPEHGPQERQPAHHLQQRGRL